MLLLSSLLFVSVILLFGLIFNLLSTLSSALQEWDDPDIKDELLNMAHIFYIQIPAHAELEIKETNRELKDGADT